jgi:hypothetical protein
MDFSFDKKTAVIDGIPTEILKADLNVTANSLLPLFTDLWTS